MNDKDFELDLELEMYLELETNVREELVVEVINSLQTLSLLLNFLSWILPLRFETQI
jgi:hypothetical protein